jgi:hypothetical protein
VLPAKVFTIDPELPEVSSHIANPGLEKGKFSIPFFFSERRMAAQTGRLNKFPGFIQATTELYSKGGETSKKRPPPPGERIYKCARCRN